MRRLSAIFRSNDCHTPQMTHPAEQGYARALGALDTTLVQPWGSLPKGSQEALADTYRRLGLRPPSQRK